MTELFYEKPAHLGKAVILARSYIAATLDEVQIERGQLLATDYATAVDSQECYFADMGYSCFFIRHLRSQLVKCVEYENGL